MRFASLKTLVLTLCLLFLPATSLFAVEVGQHLIPFQGIDLAGKSLDMKDIIGHKPVMLIFWASWCPNCREEVPKIKELVEKYQSRGMAFVGVNVGYNDSVDRAQAFVQKYGLHYPSYFDGGGRVSDQYQVMGVPTVIVADKRGVVRYMNFMVPGISEGSFNKLMAD